MSIKALEQHLAPLIPFINGKGVTEVCINQPGELYVEKAGKFTRYALKAIGYDFLLSLAALIAEFNNKEFPIPLVSGVLPTGERVQLIMSPACETEKIIFSIRCQKTRDLSLNDFDERGAFDDVSIGSIANAIADDELRELYQTKNILEFIKLAILSKKNILISGGTGTGKTTFLNACLKWIPNTERIITVEDTREVLVNQPNAVHLLFNEEDKQITALKIFKSCLRLRPDRIFLSELRGDEVWPFLRAANSGHPGSISTVHADTPEGAITQLVFMMQQAGSTSSEERIRDYIKSIIHVVIQLKRDPKPERFMYVSDVWFNNEN